MATPTGEGGAGARFTLPPRRKQFSEKVDLFNPLRPERERKGKSRDKKRGKKQAHGAGAGGGGGGADDWAPRAALTECLHKCKYMTEVEKKVLCECLVTGTSDVLTIRQVSKVRELLSGVDELATVIQTHARDRKELVNRLWRVVRRSPAQTRELDAGLPPPHTTLAESTFQCMLCAIAGGSSGSTANSGVTPQDMEAVTGRRATRRYATPLWDMFTTPSGGGSGSGSGPSPAERVYFVVKDALIAGEEPTVRDHRRAIHSDDGPDPSVFAATEVDIAQHLGVADAYVAAAAGRCVREWLAVLQTYAAPQAAAVPLAPDDEPSAPTATALNATTDRTNTTADGDGASHTNQTSFTGGKSAAHASSGASPLSSSLSPSSSSFAPSPDSVEMGRARGASARSHSTASVSTVVSSATASPLGTPRSDVSASDGASQTTSDINSDEDDDLAAICGGGGGVVPIDVCVTGHGRGGAIALLAAVLLYSTDTTAAAPPAEASGAKRDGGEPTPSATIDVHVASVNAYGAPRVFCQKDAPQAFQTPASAAGSLSSMRLRKERSRSRGSRRRLQKEREDEAFDVKQYIPKCVSIFVNRFDANVFRSDNPRLRAVDPLSPAQHSHAHHQDTTTFNVPYSSLEDQFMMYHIDAEYARQGAGGQQEQQQPPPARKRSPSLHDVQQGTVKTVPAQGGAGTGTAQGGSAAAKAIHMQRLTPPQRRELFNARGALRKLMPAALADSHILGYLRGLVAALSAVSGYDRGLVVHRPTALPFTKTAAAAGLDVAAQGLAAGAGAPEEEAWLAALERTIFGFGDPSADAHVGGPSGSPNGGALSPLSQVDPQFFSSLSEASMSEANLNASASPRRAERAALSTVEVGGQRVTLRFLEDLRRAFQAFATATPPVGHPNHTAATPTKKSRVPALHSYSMSAHRGNGVILGPAEKLSPADFERLLKASDKYISLATFVELFEGARGALCGTVVNYQAATGGLGSTGTFTTGAGDQRPATAPVGPRASRGTFGSVQSQSLRRPDSGGSAHSFNRRDFLRVTSWESSGSAGSAPGRGGTFRSNQDSTFAHPMVNSTSSLPTRGGDGGGGMDYSAFLEIIFEACEGGDVGWVERVLRLADRPPAAPGAGAGGTTRSESPAHTRASFAGDGIARGGGAQARRVSATRRTSSASRKTSVASVSATLNAQPYKNIVRTDLLTPEGVLSAEGVFLAEALFAHHLPVTCVIPNVLYEAYTGHATTQFTRATEFETCGEFVAWFTDACRADEEFGLAVLHRSGGGVNNRALWARVALPAERRPPWSARQRAVALNTSVASASHQNGGGRRHVATAGGGPRARARSASGQGRRGDAGTAAAATHETTAGNSNMAAPHTGGCGGGGAPDSATTTYTDDFDGYDPRDAGSGMGEESGVYATRMDSMGDEASHATTSDPRDAPQHDAHDVADSEFSTYGWSPVRVAPWLITRTYQDGRAGRKRGAYYRRILSLLLDLQQHTYLLVVAVEEWRGRLPRPYPFPTPEAEAGGEGAAGGAKHPTHGVPCNVLLDALHDCIELTRRLQRELPVCLDESPLCAHIDTLFRLVGCAKPKRILLNPVVPRVPDLKWADNYLKSEYLTHAHVAEETLDIARGGVCVLKLCVARIVGVGPNQHVHARPVFAAGVGGSGSRVSQRGGGEGGSPTSPSYGRKSLAQPRIAVGAGCATAMDPDASQAASEHGVYRIKSQQVKAAWLASAEKALQDIEVLKPLFHSDPQGARRADAATGAHPSAREQAHTRYGGELRLTPHQQTIFALRLKQEQNDAATRLLRKYTLSVMRHAWDILRTGLRHMRVRRWNESKAQRLEVAHNKVLSARYYDMFRRHAATKLMFSVQSSVLDPEPLVEDEDRDDTTADAAAEAEAEADPARNPEPATPTTSGRSSPLSSPRQPPTPTRSEGGQGSGAEDDEAADTAEEDAEAGGAATVSGDAAGTVKAGAPKEEEKEVVVSPATPEPSQPLDPAPACALEMLIIECALRPTGAAHGGKVSAVRRQAAAMAFPGLQRVWEGLPEGNETSLAEEHAEAGGGSHTAEMERATRPLGLAVVLDALHSSVCHDSALALLSFQSRSAPLPALQRVIEARATAAAATAALLYECFHPPVTLP